MFAGCLQIMWAHWQLIRVDGVGYLQLIRAQNTANDRLGSLAVNQMCPMNDCFLLSRYILATPNATTFPRPENFFKYEPLPISNLLKLAPITQEAKSGQIRVGTCYK